MRFVPAVSIALIAALALSGCATGTGSTSPGTIAVVASTDVWGSVAQAVGGDFVAVTSIINDPNKDPHEYAANARNQLELSRARVVIENGGGYDDFVDTMLAAANNPTVTMINAVTVSGHASDANLNEHVFYDFPSVKAIAAALATAFSALDPAHASAFAANSKGFESQLDSLITTESTLKASHSGEGFVMTEPVPAYLLAAIGLVDKTPQEFSKAIENGTDAAPSVVQSTIDVITSGSVRFLAYNEQAAGVQTQLVLSAARGARVPVVPVTETLPQGKNYVSWMTDTLTRVSQALSS